MVSFRILPAVFSILLLSTLIIQNAVTSENIDPDFETAGRGHQAGVDSWRSFRGGLTNQGVSLSPTAPETNRTMWKFDSGDDIFSTAVVTETTVYFGSWDRHLHALDALTGRELWKFDTGDRIYSSPTLWNDLVFIGTGTEGGNKIARLFAVNAKTGEEVWSFRAEMNFVGGATVVDGILYAGSIDGTLYALDAEGRGDGSTSVYWQFETGGEIWSTPAYYNHSLYITSGDCKLYRIDIETGKELWSFQTEFALDGMWSSPSIGEGTVYVGSVKSPLGVFYAVDADSGMQIWNFTTGLSRYGVAASAVYYNKTVYFGSNNGIMYAFDALSGNELWNFSTGDDYNGIYSSATYADGKLYFGSSDNVLYSLDAGTGKLIWSFRSGGFGEYGCVASPVVVSGRLYIGFTGDNTFYCFGDTVVPSIDLSLDIIDPNDKSTRAFVYAGETVEISISTTGSGSPINSAEITLSSDAGAFASDSGLTNDNGIYETVFTAPEVKRTTSIEITFKTEAAGFITNESVFLIEVRLNPPLEYKLDTAFDSITASSSLHTFLTVLDGGKPAENATVELRVTDGAVSPITAKTNKTGLVSITYTAPAPDENNTESTVEITIHIIKQGYETGKYSEELKVVPQAPPDASNKDSGIDPVMVGMIIIIVILITGIFAGLKTRGKRYW